MQLLMIVCGDLILKGVSAHGKNMRAQAKKIIVASLRSENSAQSAECKFAKVALMTIYHNHDDV